MCFRNSRYSVLRSRYQVSFIDSLYAVEMPSIVFFSHPSFGSEFYSKLEEDRCTLRADRQRKAFAVSGIIYSLLQCFIPMVMCSAKSYLDT